MRKCPELVFASPRFDVYRAVSQHIHAILRDYTPLVEPLSLDEAYLDVTDNLARCDNADRSTIATIRSGACRGLLERHR
jgi:DNA polymerase IV